ncbi:FAD:protein FMN transferase [Nocardioides sp.]|uniref:FAD:protein FMN transferase n=1 Tax=Nocardioides sp. TaxID=35761 RepID=UPI00356B331B
MSTVGLARRATDSAPPVRRYVEHVMGMPISLALRGAHTDDRLATGAWEEAVAALRDVDRVFSPFRADSFISRLDRGEIEVEDCPPEVAAVLEIGERMRLESGGAFNVWRVGPEERLTLDPSGVVKGWAVERAARPLASLPETDVCLSAGGDMVCHVAAATSPDWRVGVENPLDPTRMVAMVPIRNGGVATSGSAHRGAHVVDARTGVVPTALASVTVVAGDLTTADLDATAAFAMGGAGIEWLRDRRGRSGVVVWADGRAEVFG